MAELTPPLSTSPIPSAADDANLSTSPAISNFSSCSDPLTQLQADVSTLGNLLTSQLRFIPTDPNCQLFQQTRAFVTEGLDTARQWENNALVGRTPIGDKHGERKRTNQVKKSEKQKREAKPRQTEAGLPILDLEKRRKKQKETDEMVDLEGMDQEVWEQAGLGTLMDYANMSDWTVLIQQCWTLLMLHFVDALRCLVEFVKMCDVVVIIITVCLLLYPSFIVFGCWRL